MEKEKKTTPRPYSSVDTMNSFGSAECKDIQGSKQKMKFQGLDAQGRGAFPLPLGFTPPEDPESQKKTSCLDIIFNTGSNRFKSSAVTDVASSRLFCSSFFSMSEMESGLLSRSNKTEESFTLDVDPTRPAHSEVPVRRQSLKAEMPEDNMYQGFNVILTETDMFSLLDLSPTLISEDAEDAETVKQRNIHYAECCKNRMDDDNYLERSSQTFVGEPKNKHTQANRNSSINEGTTATIWDMYDSFCEPKETRETQKADQEDLFVSTKKEQDKTERTMSGDTADSTVSSSEMETCGECLEVEPGRDKFLLSESFKNNLLVTERVILLNVFQPKLADFRGLPVLKDPYSTVKPSFEIQSTEDKDSTLSPTMEYLWTFACPLTTGHNLTSMTWNKKNSGVLAIGFGDWASGSPKPGLVCCWSLKNLTWPERVFPCHSSVTCLDFSANNPSQLAVGMYDGSVAIYNVQVGNHMACIANSRDCSKRHQQPVWQVIWTKQQLQLSGEEREEVLVSVSGDGRITKWLVLSNGFNCIDLMVVKRIQDHKKVPAGNQEKCDIVLLPRTPVHCVDFHPTDTGTYVIGTWDGRMHVCSFFNSEHFVDTYNTLSSPVNQVEWSLFSPDVFLSCSANWTIQLWKLDSLTPKMRFTSVQSPVDSVKWSPNCSTVFAAVYRQRVDVWDLSSSTLLPTVVHHAAPGVTLTSVLFAKGSDCILVGDNEGEVTVYKLKDFRNGKEKQVNSLDDIMHTVPGYLPD